MHFLQKQPGSAASHVSFDILGLGNVKLRIFTLMHFMKSDSWNVHQRLTDVACDFDVTPLC